MQILPIVVLFFVGIISNYIRKLIKSDVIYKQISIFIENTIKSILSQYPSFNWEEILAKTLTLVEQKFGSSYFSSQDFETMIRAIIKDLTLSDTQVLTLVDKLAPDSTYMAQQKYLLGEIKAEERKQYALNHITTGLESAKVNPNQNNYLLTYMDDKVEAAVYKNKTNNELIGQTETAQVKQLQDKLNQLDKINQGLKAKINTIQSTVK